MNTRKPGRFHRLLWGNPKPYRWTPTTPVDDFEADLAHMHRLIAELAVHAGTDQLTRTAAQPSPEWDIDLYLEPWPENFDLAGDMLNAWRAGTGTELDIYSIGVAS